MRIISLEVTRECGQCGATVALEQGDLYFDHYEFDGMEFPNFDCPNCRQRTPFKDPPYLWWKDAPRTIIPSIFKKVMP